MTEGSRGAGATPASSSQRLDKWLWFVRVVRTRTLAAGLVTDGCVRVNKERVIKPSHTLRIGDVVTVSVGGRVRVLEVVAAGDKRGSADDARHLFRDLTPPREAAAPPLGGLDATGQGSIGAREAGSGRPTKRDRRALDRLRCDS